MAVKITNFLIVLRSYNMQHSLLKSLVKIPKTRNKPDILESYKNEQYRKVSLSWCIVEGSFYFFSRFLGLWCFSQTEWVTYLPFLPCLDPWFIPPVLHFPCLPCYPLSLAFSCINLTGSFVILLQFLPTLPQDWIILPQEEYSVESREQPHEASWVGSLLTHIQVLEFYQGQRSKSSSDKSWRAKA